MTDRCEPDRFDDWYPLDHHKVAEPQQNEPSAAATSSAAPTLLTLAAALVGAGLAARYAVRRSRRIDLAGRVALITGGSRGLGLVLARQLAEEGCHVAICARDHAELHEAVKDLRTHGVEPLAVPCDLTLPDQIESMIRTVKERFGPIDLLINNAGIIQVGPAEHQTRADYEEAMALHFWAPYHAITAVLPDMIARGEGRIVNVTSIGGRVAIPHLAPYCASKFALDGFSQSMRAELHQHGIYVTTVAPGLMRTGSPRNAFFKGQHRKEYAWFALSDANPLISMHAAKAARKIINAMRHGQPDLVLQWSAKLGTAVHALMPGLTQDLAAAANALLPDTGGVGAARVQGKRSESTWTASALNEPNREAARHNNEM